MTDHGGTVSGPGATTVFIGNLNAAVMGDNHVCVIPPSSPHPPSPFTLGSNSVFIEGKPAIRVGDKCGCGAGAILGELTVEVK